MNPWFNPINWAIKTKIAGLTTVGLVGYNGYHMWCQPLTTAEQRYLCVNIANNCDEGEVDRINIFQSQFDKLLEMLTRNLGPNYMKRLREKARTLTVSCLLDLLELYASIQACATPRTYIKALIDDLSIRDKHKEISNLFIQLNEKDEKWFRDLLSDPKKGGI